MRFNFVRCVKNIFTVKDIANVLLGAFLGTVLGIGVSAYYYKKSGEDLDITAKGLATKSDVLEQQTKQLHKLNEIMLLGMEHNGWIDLVKDNQGHVIGWNQKITGKPGSMTFTGAPGSIEISNSNSKK